MAKVFISGQISNAENFDHFTIAEKHLQKCGNVTVNPEGLIRVYGGVPNDFGEATDDKFRNFWLKEALKLMLECDTIYFCPGELSNGMKLELYVAKALGMNIWNEPRE